MKKSRHGRLGVDAMLSDQTKKTKFIRSHMFLKVLSSLRMLLSQGVPIRGHDYIEGSLMQLLLLRSEDDPQLKKWITMLRDETRDVSNREKLTLCIRWIDEDFTIHEDLIGIVHVDKTNSDLKCY